VEPCLGVCQPRLGGLALKHPTLGYDRAEGGMRVCSARPPLLYGSGMADVSVTLSSDEALVLFEVLHRWEDTGLYERADLEPGERTALWALSGRLESLLVEPFEAAYGDLVDRARERLWELGGA